MPFTINELSDLTNLLRRYPEWRAEVRRLVLTDDILELPATVERLAVAQERTEQRLNQLVVAQERTEQRLNQLAVAQERTEQQLGQLAKEVLGLKEVTAQMQTKLNRFDHFEGRQLEQRYAERAPSYFGDWLRRLRLLWPGRFDPQLEDLIDTGLSNDERSDILRLDLIVRGRAIDLSIQSDLYLGVEISLTINLNDVVRAQRRTNLLKKLGLTAIPVVAGESIDEEALLFAQQNHIPMLNNGHSQGWQEALAQVKSSRETNAA